MCILILGMYVCKSNARIISAHSKLPCACRAREDFADICSGLHDKDFALVTRTIYK